MKNLYKILNIGETATPDQVKKAYFEMAKKYHPDSSDKAELGKFYEICEAYQILSDKEERRAYDLTLGGGKIEKVLVNEPPAHPTIFKEENVKDKKFREKEMRRFRRRIFLQGILRSVGFSVFTAVIGYILSLVLGGIGIFGMIAGFAIGLVIGVNWNFDVTSFIRSSVNQLIIRIISWIILIGGVGYFGWLILKFF